MSQRQNGRTYDNEDGQVGADGQGLSSESELRLQEWKRQKEEAKKNQPDYRRYKIETPPPRAHSPHEAVSLDLDGQVANLTKHRPIYRGREKLLKMLLEMYIDVSQIEDSVWEKVPLWDEIQAAHGKSPVVYGLDTCEAFRKSVPAVDRHIGIAGLFSSGTNLLAILLQHNCAIPEGVAKWGRKKGHGMEWQVPYGKHSPPRFRDSGHKVRNFLGEIPINQEMITVMTRNPYDWIGSMCRHAYTIRWNHTKRKCPNLIEGTNTSTRARFGPGRTEHESIIHMWNDWYGGYYHNKTYPRLMVRFEDTIFYPKEVSEQICSCVGGVLMPPKEDDGIFHYVIDSAVNGKGHGSADKRNGLLDGWIKYGRKSRPGTFTKKDLDFIEKYADKEILETMRWSRPE